jgi:hypothetical protein
LLLSLFELHLFTRKENKVSALAMVIDQFFERMYQVASTGIKSIASKVNFPTPRLIPRPIGPASGWHGWVYGWKLHVVSLVAAVWFPIAAVLTPANVADSEPAPTLLREVPAEVRFILGDRHYNTPDLRQICERDDRLLVTTQYGRYPHTDDGVEVRRIFHKLRSLAMENFNEHFKGIFDGHGQVPDLWLARDSTLRIGSHLCLSTGSTVPL